MGFYGSNTSIEEGVQDKIALGGYFILDEVAQLTDEKKTEFLASENCKILQEKGFLHKKTLVRLNKTDDLSRRIKIASFQIAKEKDDPLWAALVKNRVKERELISKITQKYGNAGTRDAKVAQKTYLSGSLSPAFMRPASTAAGVKR